jgi:glycosyltransferase involved in cell wall biosynthesis
MKIIYILNAFPILTQTWIPLEIRELRELGDEVEVTTLGGSAPAAGRGDGAAGPPCWRLPTGGTAARFTAFLHHVIWKLRSPRRYFRTFFFVLARADRQSLALFATAPRVASHVRGRGARWLHSHFADQGTEMAMLVSMLTGIPFSFTPHAHDLWEHPRLLADKMTRATFVATISEHNRRWCLEHFGTLGREHFPLVRVGVDTTRFSRRAGDDSPQRAAGEPVRVVTVGRLIAKKGHDLLLQAGRLAAGKNQPLEIRIAGEGPEEAALRRTAGEAPGSGCTIRFLGALTGEQVFLELSSADIFALACRRSPDGDMDGIPASLMEAMAMELPVVTTALSGIPELVEDRRHGRLVEPDDLVGLAKALADLAAMSAGDRRAMGRAGRQKVNAEFDCRRTAVELQRQIRRHSSELEQMDDH